MGIESLLGKGKPKAGSTPSESDDFEVNISENINSTRIIVTAFGNEHRAQQPPKLPEIPKGNIRLFDGKSVNMHDVIKNKTNQYFNKKEQSKIERKGE